MSIGKNIKIYRKKSKLTQVELAERAKMSRSYLADIEADRYNPSVDTLKTVADALEIPIHILLGEESQSPVDPYDLTPKEERDIAKRLEQIMADLESDMALAYHGEPLDDEEDREALRASLENTLRLSKYMAKKKFTPNKYRK
ncbi:helix-turn-helix domain-containing protein [Paenibacillus oleatilyticus]|uniref:Helix-turn-helix domain-containing protein n=1 Tax=Paenibacillus oleatilyticus TaxID=2594886 RepID=A0ABV4UT49_9BACL